MKPFKTKQLFNSLVCILALSGCVSETQSGQANSNILDTNEDLVIEKSATIPVLDGQSVTTGIYIRNIGKDKISGINYELAGVNGDDHAKLLNPENCREILGNKSCLLKFKTNKLNPGEHEADLLIAKTANGLSKGILNYAYYDSNEYAGVSFSDDGINLNGPDNYATVYSFVGKKQAMNNVGFTSDNNSVFVNSEFRNPVTNFSSNEVVPLEVSSAVDVTDNYVNVYPYLKTSSSSKLISQNMHSKNIVGSNLQVTVSPGYQANLIMSSLPLLSGTGDKVATLTVVNNGNIVASEVTPTTPDANISIAPGDSNPCGSTLGVSQSCNYKVALINTAASGSGLINVSYNNGVSAVNSSQTVNYYTNNNSPMVSLLPSSTVINQSVLKTSNVTFNVNNNGNAPLTVSSISAIKNLSSTAITQSNNCGSTIAANGSCIITATITSSVLEETGKFYLKILGSFTNSGTASSYSFVSTPVSVVVYNQNKATVSSTTPANNAINVSTSTGITINFSESMSATTLNNSNIRLLKVSDQSNVPLTLSGVTNNNQTVTFTQTTGKLADLNQYQIVINPDQIKTNLGVPMAQGTTSQIVSNFLTGDNTAPTIVTILPANNATNVNTSPVIQLTFSESMNPTTLNTSNIILYQNTTPVSGTSISISNANRTATVNLASALSSSTAYNLKINQTAITDTAGNALGTGITTITTFTTGDFTAPVISAITPVNGAAGIPVTQKPTIQFNEPMLLSTVTTQNIRVFNSSTITPLNAITTVNNAGGTLATINPSGNLAANTLYNIQIIPANVKDLAGNPIGPESTWVTRAQFRTAANMFAWISGSQSANSTMTFSGTTLTSFGYQQGGGAAGYMGLVRTRNALWEFGNSRGYYGYGWANLLRYDLSTNSWSYVKGPGANLGVGPTYPSAANIEGSSFTPSFFSANPIATDGESFIYVYGPGNSNASMNGQTNYYSNVLWRFNTNTNNWSVLPPFNPAGVDNLDPSGYGLTIGVERVSNQPGINDQLGGMSMCFMNNYLYLYVASNRYASTGTNFNQNAAIWRYNLATQQWALMSNTSLNITKQINPVLTNFSTTEDGVTTPGSSYGLIACDAANNRVWFMANSYVYQSGSTNYKSDVGAYLWLFNPISGNWRYIKGVSQTSKGSIPSNDGVYGTKGTPSSANYPGSRIGNGLVFSNGYLWLFGGMVKYQGSPNNYYNDLWRFDPTTNMWTWMAGTNLTNQDGYYGTQYVATGANYPAGSSNGFADNTNAPNGWSINAMFPGFESTDLYIYAPKSSQYDQNNLIWRYTM